MFIAKRNWSGSRSLVSTALLMLGTHLGSSCLSCHYPVLWRSYSVESAGQVTSHVPADHRRGGWWGRPGHSHGSVSGQLYGWSARWEMETALPCLQRLGWLAHTCTQGRLFHCHEPALPPASAIEERRRATLSHPCYHKTDGHWEQLYHVHNFRADSLPSALTGLTLLCSSGEV